jgi:RND family efflux transporter MFP subunit
MLTLNLLNSPGARTRVLITLFCFALLGSVSCAKHEEEDPRRLPQLVQVTTGASPSRSGQLFTGVVTARVQSDLGFRVSGKVTERLVDVGSNVRAQQPLMRIDITDYEHAITTQAETVAAAKARADQAAADEARYRGLVATGAIAASTYDQVKATADSAQAQLLAAQAQERIARNQGNYSLILADSDGTVVETLAEPGQVVAAGQTIIRLAHAGPREAAIYLPETVRPRLGSIAQATLFGRSGAVPARLRQLSDAADATTRTFEARYVLGGVGASAPLGSTVTIQLNENGVGRPLAVPNAALTDRGNGPGVWLLDRKTSTVIFRRVSVSKVGDENTEISSGIEPGDEVVSLGAHLLRDGQHVRVAGSEVAQR